MFLELKKFGGREKSRPFFCAFKSGGRPAKKQGHGDEASMTLFFLAIENQLHTQFFLHQRRHVVGLIGKQERPRTGIENHHVIIFGGDGFHGCFHFIEDGF